MNIQESLAELTQRNVDTIAKIESAARAERTRGERTADAIAIVIGSWGFILTQSGFLAIWMVLNLVALVKHWDPYQFILLNLALSFQAAFAGPIIMMSQNRQSRFSKRRNQLDLQINLLSEQENAEILRLLRLLCEKSGVEREQLASKQMLNEEIQPDALIQQIAETAEDEPQSKPH